MTNINDKDVSAHEEDIHDSDINNKDITDEEYEKALEDFSRRLIIVELPDDTKGIIFTRYVKQVLGIKCVMALINHNENIITPLPDDFEIPYDPITMWAIAVKNSISLTSVNEDASKKEENLYIISSHSGRALVCCDDFWNQLCEKTKTVRLLVHMYRECDEKSFILASPLENESEIDVRTYLHEANKEEKFRTSYIFCKNTGMLSEAALNSEY